MKIFILLLFIILIFIIHKNIFYTEESYRDYGTYTETRGPSGLSIQNVRINDLGKIVFILSNNSEITTTNSVFGSKGQSGRAGLSINKDDISYDETTGELSIKLSNGEVVPIGNIKGPKGTTERGLKGPPGVGINTIDVDQTTGDLIVTLNDGSEPINAGNVKGEKGADCKNIPQGIIVAWAGSSTNIPNDWLLCDGKNGTPNLQGRFILGSNSTYPPGTIGGEMTHTLALNEIPNHKHKTPNTNLVQVDKLEDDETLEEAILSTDDDSVIDNSTDIIGYNGVTEPHNNMPPYFALCFIMKE